MAKNRKSLTIIVGCGRLGSSLANKLSDDQQDVVVIDRHQDSFRRLSSTFAGLTFMGDGCDFDVLNSANIKSAGTVVALTDFDNNNILIGEVAKTMYNVEKVIVRINDKDKEFLCTQMGIETLCPYELSSDNLLELMAEEGARK